MKANWEKVPEHIRDGLKLYIAKGLQPGDFLTAVLCNDLREACARADDINRHRLFDIVSFLYCYAPAACWGSTEKFAAWRKQGGLGEDVTEF